jgi:hypothetical protein
LHQLRLFKCFWEILENSENWIGCRYGNKMLYITLLLNTKQVIFQTKLSCISQKHLNNLNWCKLMQWFSYLIKISLKRSSFEQSSSNVLYSINCKPDTIIKI